MRESSRLKSKEPHLNIGSGFGLRCEIGLSCENGLRCEIGVMCEGLGSAIGDGSIGAAIGAIRGAAAGPISTRAGEKATADVGSRLNLS